MGNSDLPTPPVAPEILTPPDNTTVVQGDNAVFTCVATGRPMPRIDWYQVDRDNATIRTLLNDSSDVDIMNTTMENDTDDMSLTMENDIDIVSSAMGERNLTSNLTILNAQPDNATEYVCEAVSEVEAFPVASARAVLTVHGEYTSIL